MKLSKKLRLLYIYNSSGSWINTDLRLLNEFSDVRECELSLKSYFQLKLYWDLLWAKSLFLWFGSIQFLPLAFLARFLRKEIYIVAGGFDVISLPEYSYGAFSERYLKVLLRKLLFKMSTRVFCVSDSSMGHALQNMPFLKRKAERIYLAYPETLGEQPTEDQAHTVNSSEVVMVASVDKIRYSIKGMDSFIEIARTMPSVRFHHIGSVTGSCLPADLPENIQFHGALNIHQEEAGAIIRRCKIVLQLSVYESFGMALLELAGMGLYPIVYRAGALPELVGDQGGLVESQNIEQLKLCIEEILANDVNRNELVHYYRDRFAHQKRQKALKRQLIAK